LEVYLEDIVKFVTDSLLPHWPFLTTLVIFMMIGQVVKTVVFPRSGHLTRTPLWLFWWGRKTLPLHPILCGALLGVLWRSPEPGITSLPASIGYFAMAGALSVWAYEFLKGLAKKQGIDLSLPGVDETIPPPPPGKPTDG
jgi:hypothetical protein